MSKFIIPIFFVLISQFAGIVGSIFTVPAIATWYAKLTKPSFNPPGWIFGPVWILLYTMMGISAYLVWQKWGESGMARVGVMLFFVHLIFNALWSYLFFGLKNPMFAFFEIIVLWLMILAMIIIYYQINKTASYLLIPYIMWVSFASVLNFYIWKLN